MIIGLCGPAGSGKTTIAKALSQDYGYTRRAFAYPLKAMIAAGFNIEMEVLDGPKEVKALPLEVFGGKTLREVMQRLGTEWGREMISQDIWVRAWERMVWEGGNFIADDVRFGNECDAIHRLGGVVIRLHRTGAGITGNHASEHLDFETDHDIDNDRPVDQVCRAIINFAAQTRMETLTA